MWDWNQDMSNQYQRYNTFQTLFSAMVAGAVQAALKKKGRTFSDKTGPTFYTPARFGWGKVAMELHPEMAQVRFIN